MERALKIATRTQLNPVTASGRSPWTNTRTVDSSTHCISAMPINVKTFDDVPAGTELQLPSKRELARRWPELCPRSEAGDSTTAQHADATYDARLSERLYITKKGDTLFDIAAKKLGQASRYVDIMAINDQRLPTQVSHLSTLKAGLKLVLPE